MNFLAHLYLSGDNVHVRLGNFIGDHVKGKAFTHYPPDVQKGILMHRAIDSFTDNHLATAESKRLLRSGYGKYAGVVVDVFYDHLLASNWSNFSPFPLRGFTRGFYYQM
ncbi:MAG TPA: ACP phosphodiesterase, partial [Tenuifilaceae bacterium]|nr:ACP phosphodiesterase [Tenuifilaceae bacterium]